MKPRIALLFLALAVDGFSQTNTAADPVVLTPEQRAEAKKNDRAQAEAEKQAKGEKTKGRTKGGKADLIFTARDTMTREPRIVEVVAEGNLSVRLENRGMLPKKAMGHNWVLLKEGTDVAEFTKAYKQGLDKNYVPITKSDQVIAAIPLLDGGESAEITFEKPPPGTYVHLCAFPGHAEIGEQGTLTVKARGEKARPGELATEPFKRPEHKPDAAQEARDEASRRRGAALDALEASLNAQKKAAAARVGPIEKDEMGRILPEKLSRPGRGWRIYTVKPGDSQQKIATSKNMSIAELSQGNPAVVWSKIRVGQEVWVWEQ